jgi:hypothetical protein
MLVAGRTPHYNGGQSKPDLEAAMSNFEHDNVEANRLYWDTDESVANIADRLDVSRRALYDAVHPLEAGASCAACGGQLTFENRSSRKLGVALCPSCGAEQHLEPGGARLATEPGTPSLEVLRGDEPSDRIDLRDPDLRHRAVVLGSAAIAGVALGTVAAILAMRKD